MIHSLMGEEQLASEKKVVISELQGYENDPGYRLSKAVMKAAFPDHSYGLPVGGTKSDVEGFTSEQVQEYYKTYYSPDNATLVITSDFDSEAALQQVKQIYGSIARRSGNLLPPAIPAAPVSTPDVKSAEPIVLNEPGSAALIQAVYPLPAINHPDVPAIDLMDMVLTGGRSARPYQTLVETGLASGISAYPAEMLEPGWYSMSATADPSKDIVEIDRVLQHSLADLQSQGVTLEELERARTQLKTSFVLSNQDISSQASQLVYNQIVAGDYRYSDRYLEAIDWVTPADIQRVARLYLDPAKRTTGYFRPTLTDGQAAGGSSGRMVESFNPGAPVDPAEVARYLPPLQPEVSSGTEIIPAQLTLENGIRVLLPDPATPMINLTGWVEAGMSFDTAEQAGLASLTSENLLNGTQSKDALTLAKTLEDKGASLGFSARREGMDFSGNTLPENLPRDSRQNRSRYLHGVLRRNRSPGSRILRGASAQSDFGGRYAIQPVRH